MDKRIRRNEQCVIGLPRCDFVFSSTRSAFIGYGFEESSLEMNILKHLLSQKGIEPMEAGGTLAPGQNAFCAKICSKIITSQFCIILLNNDVRDGVEIPNANVNMEYGLMLGFNKYVIPFQRAEQKLPFNVAGLDTVKYTNQDFESKAALAIDTAIAATTQHDVPPITPDQLLEGFLLANRMLVVPLNTDGERQIFQLGQPLGFNLLMTFDGLQYVYFGIFTALRQEAVLWRLKTLQDIISSRVGSIEKRIEMGFGRPDARQLAAINVFIEKLQVWVLVTSDEDKAAIASTATTLGLKWPVKMFAISDIRTALENIA
jgi:hypothetical protein